MSSLTFRRRSNRILWGLSVNTRIGENFYPSLLFSCLSRLSTINHRVPRSQWFRTSIQNHSAFDSGHCSFSHKTLKNPSGSFQYHRFSRNFSVSSSKHALLGSWYAVSTKNIAGSHCSPSPSIYFNSQPSCFLHSRSKSMILASESGVMGKKTSGISSILVPPVVQSSSDIFLLNLIRLFGTETAIEPATTDGLTVEGIMANEWTILDESESDWKSHAAAIAQSIHLIKKRLKWKKLMVRLDILSAQLNKSDLWNDPVHAGRVSREYGSIMGKMKGVKAFEQELLEHIDMIKLAHEENDKELESESMKALQKMRRVSKEKELEAMLAGEQDPCSCYIEVQSGAGGTESMDWASMVMQMYKMWAQQRGYKVDVVDEMPGEVAGIKRATIKVDGEYAFGYAKAEVGVHRLVRISPFDSNKRRHTSFAAVAVIPILGDESTHVQINESDLRIERFRSGGSGGQHANTTDSAVRIVHIPTGITATCQNERSQHQNKASAMAVIQSRVDQVEMARQAQMNSQHTQSLTDITWGSQIRSYVLHPYRMVKDLRTNYEVSDPDSVLEGDLDCFIMSYLSASMDKDVED